MESDWVETRMDSTIAAWFLGRYKSGPSWLDPVQECNTTERPDARCRENVVIRVAIIGRFAWTILHWLVRPTYRSGHLSVSSLHLDC
jgi:hypothetical protein